MADDLAVADHGFSCGDAGEGDFVGLRNRLRGSEAIREFRAGGDAIGINNDGHVIGRVDANVERFQTAQFIASGCEDRFA